jgi:hypothetical protein
MLVPYVSPMGVCTLIRLRLQSAHPDFDLGWALRADIVPRAVIALVQRLGRLSCNRHPSCVEMNDVLELLRMLHERAAKASNHIWSSVRDATRESACTKTGGHPPTLHPSADKPLLPLGSHMTDSNRPGVDHLPYLRGSFPMESPLLTAPLHSWQVR